MCRLEGCYDTIANGLFYAVSKGFPFNASTTHLTEHLISYTTLCSN